MLVQFSLVDKRTDADVGGVGPIPPSSSPQDSILPTSVDKAWHSYKIYNIHDWVQSEGLKFLLNYLILSSISTISSSTISTSLGTTPVILEVNLRSSLINSSSCFIQIRIKDFKHSLFSILSLPSLICSHDMVLLALENTCSTSADIDGIERILIAI